MPDSLSTWFGDPPPEEARPEASGRPQGGPGGAVRRTAFPHVEADLRCALDEFLAATRLRTSPDYLPDASVRARWVGQARRLIRAHAGGYRTGFYKWAIGQHEAAFRAQGKVVIITGPASVDYLWDSYRDQGKVLERLGVYLCPACCTYHGEGECPEEGG